MLLGLLVLANVSVGLFMSLSSQPEQARKLPAVAAPTSANSPVAVAAANSQPPGMTELLPAAEPATAAPELFEVVAADPVPSADLAAADSELAHRE